MKITRTESQTIEKEIIEKVVCDGCGAEIVDESWRRFAVKLEAEWGNMYPECGWGNGYKIEDICKNCVHKAFMLLRENGFTVKEYEWNW